MSLINQIKTAEKTYKSLLLEEARCASHGHQSRTEACQFHDRIYRQKLELRQLLKAYFDQIKDQPQEHHHVRNLVEFYQKEKPDRQFLSRASVDISGLWTIFKLTT